MEVQAAFDDCRLAIRKPVSASYKVQSAEKLVRERQNRKENNLCSLDGLYSNRYRSEVLAVDTQSDEREIEHAKFFLLHGTKDNFSRS